MNTSTTNIIDPLVFDFVEWVSKQPRPHAEVIDAWRTSCPRLTVWEEAMDRGYVARRSVEGQGMIKAMIEVTASGTQFLREHAR